MKSQSNIPGLNLTYFQANHLQFSKPNHINSTILEITYDVCSLLILLNPITSFNIFNSITALTIFKYLGIITLDMRNSHGHSMFVILHVVWKVFRRIPMETLRLL